MKIDNNKKVNKNIRNTQPLKRVAALKKGSVRKTRHISMVRLTALIVVTTLILLGLYFVAKNSILAIRSVTGTAIEKVKDIKEDTAMQGFKKVETINVENKQVTQKEIMESLGKIVTLPEEEMKVFSKVTDAEALIKQSPVFKGTKIGDYIIVYPSVAIVYDQSNNKLVKTIALQ